MYQQRPCQEIDIWEKITKRSDGVKFKDSGQRVIQREERLNGKMNMEWCLFCKEASIGKIIRERRRIKGWKNGRSKDADDECLMGH